MPKGDIHVDALIVGGGITGITTATLLKNAGCRVAVVDLHKIGGGETAHTTAHVTHVTDARLHDLRARLGEHAARGLWEAGALAMRQITLLAAGVECDLVRVPGYLYAAEDRDAESEIPGLREDAKLAAQYGFDATCVEDTPLFDRPAVRFADQILFHPLKYLHALALGIPDEKCHLLEETDGTQLDAEARALRFDGGVIHYGALVIATHVPIQAHRSALPAALFQTKLAAYSTYALEARIPASFAASYWDTGDPYLYLRIDRSGGGCTAILGGEDHKTGQESDTEARYERLEKKLLEIFPAAVPTRRWSGQVLETPDGLPYIGAVGDRQFLATGFAGNGMTLGTFSAMLIADLIVGRPNTFADLFDPHRKGLAGAWTYVRENTDFPIHFVKDHVAPVRTTLSDLSPGEAAIVKLDGRKCAAHVDDEGKRTVLSAVCPHMGCIVNWNAAEKTWDCPCHGSRFTSSGDLVAGPAETGLEKISRAAAGK